MNEKLDIISVGECLIEMSAKESLSKAENFDKYYGGDAITFALSASRMGSKVGFITKLGNDYFKDFLINSWQNENLDISHVKIIEGYNGLYFIGHVNECEREFLYYRKKTAAASLSIEDIDEEYIKSAKVFYATGTCQTLSLSTKETIKNAYKLAKKNGLITAYDPNFTDKIINEDVLKEVFEDVYENLDIIFLNLQKDVKSLFNINSAEIIIKQLSDKGLSIIVIKSVDENKYYLGTKDEIISCDFYKIDTKDTTGAGYAFNGAFLHAYVNNYSLSDALKFAKIVAGLQSQKIGAIKSIPTKEEVLKIFEGENV